MNKIKITRDTEISGNDGFGIQTIGKLQLFSDDSEQKLLFECKSLEKGWRNNIKKVSCIPPKPNSIATFHWRVVENSPLFSYKHIHIYDVPDRTAIKIHVANRYDQLQGCVAVGMRFGYLEGDDVIDVLESRPAMEKLMQSLTTTEGTIEIISKVNQTERLPNITFADEILSSRFLIPLDDDLIV